MGNPGVTIALLFASTLPAATVVSVACGSASDTGFTGGYRYTGAPVASQPAPYNAMRSSSPAGAAFFYLFQLPAGQYNVSILMIEPRADQAAGGRLLGVAFNGTVVITGLDLFTQVGALKPYRSSFPVTITGVLKIDFSATAGNALVSGIQIDSVDVPPASTLERPVCEFLWGGGWGLSSGVYSAWGCEDLDTAPLRITRVTCRSDVPGQILDVQSLNTTGAWQTILTAPVVCTPERTEASVAPGASYSGVLLVLLRIIDPTPDVPSPSQVLVDIVRAAGSPAPVATLRECKGSGPGWNCAGLLWATIPLAGGTLELMGVEMPAPTKNTWVEKQ